MTVVAKGAGSLHLSPGTIDVLGYAPERVDEPGAGASRASSTSAPTTPTPASPPSRSARRSRGSASWRRGCGYAGDRGRNLLLPTAVGVARPTALAPAGIAARATCARERASPSSGCAR